MAVAFGRVNGDSLESQFVDMSSVPVWDSFATRWPFAKGFGRSVWRTLGYPRRHVSDMVRGTRGRTVSLGKS